MHVLGNRRKCMTLVLTVPGIKPDTFVIKISNSAITYPYFRFYCLANLLAVLETSWKGDSTH